MKKEEIMLNLLGLDSMRFYPACFANIILFYPLYPFSLSLNPLPPQKPKTTSNNKKRA